MRLPERLYVENYRGRRVPRVLGIALIACGALGMVALVPGSSDPAVQWGIGAAALLVFAAGLVDDLVQIGPRGLRGHARALASGQVTTGALKVIVTIGCAAVVVALLDRGEAAARLGAVVLVAATTNVWNGLDVRPGRALKVFLVIVVVLALLEAPADAGYLGVAMVGGACLTVVPDLREWAMLGDGGSNVLGFTAGVVLAAALPTWAMWPAAAAAVGLNVVAETVTFSRVIDAVPPLRWFDRVGRVAE